MKKRFLLITSIILVILLICGCAKRRSTVIPQTKGISFVSDITYYNESYKCKVTINEDESLIAEMLYPEDVCGLKINCFGDKTTAEYKGLCYDFNMSCVPIGSICTDIYDVFRDTWKNSTVVINDKQDYYINNQTDICNYKLNIAPTGLPLSLDIPDKSFYVEFREVTII